MCIFTHTLEFLVTKGDSSVSALTGTWIKRWYKRNKTLCYRCYIVLPLRIPSLSFFPSSNPAWDQTLTDCFALPITDHSLIIRNKNRLKPPPTPKKKKKKRNNKCAWNTCHLSLWACDRWVVKNSPVRFHQADGETLGELPHGLEKRRNIDAYTYVLPHTSVAIIITHDYHIVVFFSTGLASNRRGVEWVWSVFRSSVIESWLSNGELEAW